MATDKDQSGNSSPIVDYGQFEGGESGSQKFWRKAMDEPFVPAGENL